MGDQETRAWEVGALGCWPLHLHAVSHVACTTNNVCSEVIECRILLLVKVLGVFIFFFFISFVSEPVHQSSNILKAVFSCLKNVLCKKKISRHIKLPIHT
jgi:hypothetical protein